MRTCVRELCVLSIFCGAALSLIPEGGVKKVLRILETTVLLAVIIQGIGKLDLAPYTLQLAKLRETERELTEDSEKLKNRLDRLVIEEEYASYLEKKAEAAGIVVSEIRIQARWSKDGLWIPDFSRIHILSEAGQEELGRILWGELGIPPERQEWISDE